MSKLELHIWISGHQIPIIEDLTRGRTGWGKGYPGKIEHVNLLQNGCVATELSFFDAYNFFFESLAIVGRPDKTRIVCIYLLGRDDNSGKVNVHRMDLRSSKIESAWFPVGEEYDGAATAGWLPGSKESYS